MNKKMLKRLFSFIMAFTILFGSLNLGSIINLKADSSEPIVNEIQRDTTNLQQTFTGGKVRFIVAGRNLENAKLVADITNIATGETVRKPTTHISSSFDQQILDVEFDENTTSEKIRYYVKIKYEGFTGEDISNKIRIIVSPSGNTGGNTGGSDPVNPSTGTPKLTATSFSVDEKAKNVVTFTLTGENLDASKINLKFKTLDLTYPDFPTMTEAKDVKQETAIVNEAKTSATVKATFPENTTDTPVKYTVQFSVEGAYGHAQNKALDKEVQVVKNTTAPTPAEKTPVLTKVKTDAKINSNNKVLFELNGTDFKDGTKTLAKITTKVTLDGVRVSDIENSNRFDVLSPTFASGFLTFPVNDTTKNRVYKVYFNVDGSDNFDENFVKEITVTATKTEPVNHTTGGTLTSVKHEGINSDKLDMFTLKGTDLEAKNIKVKVMQGEERKADIESTLDTFTTPTISYPTLKFPENTTDKDITYKVYFNADGSDKFDEANSVTVVKKGKTVDPGTGGDTPVVGEMKITNVKAGTPNISEKGGQTSISVKGENLKSDKILIKVYKIENGKEVEKPEIIGNEKFDGSDKVQTIYLNFPAGKDDNYKVKIGLKEDAMQEVAVHVRGAESGTLMEIVASLTYINNEGNKIIIHFDEEMVPVKDIETLKKGLSLKIQKDDEFKPLAEEDRVTVVGKDIIIDLKEKVEITPFSQVGLAERIIKDPRTHENMVAHYIIKKSVPMVMSYEFLEGETLDSKGGKVSLKLKGENLNLENLTSSEKNKHLVLVRVNKLLNENQPQIEITPTVEYTSDKEINITFNVPANTSKTTESYMIRVSTDAGRKYSSELVANIYELRSKRLITSVLPEGADPTKPTLSFMSIQSYGTSGGGTDKPDTTHTNLPTGQESKKTWVYVYGTNLDKTKTKVKIVDENGIEWTPIRNEGTSDSMDNFIMVGFDGYGVSGNGNNQMIEIICPRNIKGSKEKDRTYKYLLAVDGENFNQEIYVTATVLDDGAPDKLDGSANSVREVAIAFEDESGNTIADGYTIKGYTWSKLKSFGAKVKDIENYKIVGMKTDVKTDLMDIVQLEEEKLSENKKVTFVYKKVKTDPVTPVNPVDPVTPDVNTDTTDEYKWVQNTDGTWNYKNANENSKIKDQWKKIDNKWYLFDKDGTMLESQWVKSGENWYWLESNGSMSENEWIYVNGSWFYAHGNGVIAENQWLFIDGSWFYAKAGGYIAENEWIYVDGKWYYAKAGGYIAQSESLEIDKTVYSFDDTCAWID